MLSEVDVARFCNAIIRLFAADANPDDLNVLLDVLDVACKAESETVAS